MLLDAASIKTRLIGMIIVALVLAVGASSFLIYMNAKTVILNDATKSVEALAMSSSREIGLWLSERQSYLAALANTPLLRSGGQAEILPYLAAEVERTRQYETMFVTDENGQYYSYTRSDSQVVTGDTGSLLDRPYFKHVMTTGQAMVVNPVPSKSTRNPVAVVVVPIKAEGRIVGVLGGTISLDELIERVGAIRVAQTGYAYVVQDDGLTIIHPDKERAMKENTLRYPGSYDKNLINAIAQMTQGKSGIARYSLNNVSKYMGYAPIPGANWSLAVCVPENEVTEQLSTVRFMALVTPLFIATLLGMITALFVTVTIIRPISNLQVCMKAIAANGFKESVILTKYIDVYREDEIGQLACAFKKMVDKIQEYNLNLEHLVKERTEELEKAYREMKQLDELKTSFLSTVSHELRTPLTSVMGFAKIIHRRLEHVVVQQALDDDNKSQRGVRQIKENVSIILKEGRRLTELIDDLLDLANLEAGGVAWKTEEISLPEMLEEAIGATRIFWEEKGLAVVRQISPDVPAVLGDKGRLTQVMVNLLSNAVKFTERGSITCKIDMSVDCRFVIVAIKDTGIGIEPHNHGKVFEKFRQIGDTLTDKPKGTGLGLPICRQIIEHHGGSIWLESELGKGSVFFFSLPIHEKTNDR